MVEDVCLPAVGWIPFSGSNAWVVLQGKWRTRRVSWKHLLSSIQLVADKLDGNRQHFSHHSRQYTEIETATVTSPLQFLDMPHGTVLVQGVMGVWQVKLVLISGLVVLFRCTQEISAVQERIRPNALYDESSNMLPGPP